MNEDTKKLIAFLRNIGCHYEENYLSDNGKIRFLTYANTTIGVRIEVDQQTQDEQNTLTLLSKPTGMTNEQLFKAAIEQAERNGWKASLDVNRANTQAYAYWLQLCVYDHSCFKIIFDHSFAKAFFANRDWQAFLQDMVLQDDPLRYLERYL